MSTSFYHALSTARKPTKIHLFANHILTKKYHHDNDENVNHLRQVIGILQHHDAVIGTAKQHVTNDYAWHLYNATKSC
ncbi:unnamed protein product [Schistosoma margrebowiei]|uniref:Glycoside hydrolase family 38 central domain-containing protein n=1 Tax=Schistosoma margrebowiei TaxID=48269 RepID=A0AA84ZCB2_9TREM|nr:unnamed protein product [Schistosoma margrebowiei]